MILIVICKFYHVLLVFLCGAITFSCVKCGQHEDRLINDIFTTRGYNKYSRPVANESNALVVRLGLALQQIISVDEKQEMLHTNTWLDYEWHDYNLEWNSNDYGNVTSIRLPANSIWTPDLLLYNSADEDIDSKFPTNVVVSFDGTCSWVPLGLFISTCSINILYYPFDEQFCTMKFGSWTYDGSRINLTAKTDSINLDTYSQSGEWDLLETPAKRSVKFYDCCPQPYIDITFTLHLRRRTLYHGLNLIIPCALISMLALFTFTLPPDSNAKVTLGVTVVLALSMFQMIVAGIVPPTSLAVPLVGVYSACLMIMCTISLTITIVVISFHYRKPEMSKMSPFIRKYICGWLAWLLCMSKPGHPITFAGLRQKQLEGPSTKPTTIISVISNGCDVIDTRYPLYLSKSHHNHPSAATEAQHNHPSTSSTSPQPIGIHEGIPAPVFVPYNGLPLLCPVGKQTAETPLAKARTELAAILAELTYITKKIKDDDDSGDEENEWKFAAMVVDRLCLWIFTVFLSIATAWSFFSAPTVRDALHNSIFGADELSNT